MCLHGCNPLAVKQKNLHSACPCQATCPQYIWIKVWALSARSQARHRLPLCCCSPCPHVSPVSTVLDTLELGTVFLFLVPQGTATTTLWCVAAFVEGLGMKENDHRIADDLKLLRVCLCLRPYSWVASALSSCRVLFTSFSSEL